MVITSMAFEKLDFKRSNEIEMMKRSKSFHESIIKRRTVRDFSDEKYPLRSFLMPLKAPLPLLLVQINSRGTLLL